MPKRIRACFNFALPLSLILCAFQSSARLAFSADTSTPEDIAVIECDGIQYDGAQRVEFHYDGNELKLIGISNANTQFVIARTKPKTEVVTTAADFRFRCHGDTVSITTRFPSKSVFITQVYKWDGKTLRQIKTEITDANLDVIDSALEEALKGNLAEAFSNLQGLSYAWNSPDCGIIVQEFLEKGHKASLSIQKTKGFKQAATALGNTLELMSEVAYRYSGTSEPEIRAVGPKRWLETFHRCEIAKSKYVLALNDYGFFLQQSGQAGKAVRILSLVTSEAPERTVAYLNLADAQWSLGKRQEAITNYTRYNKMMIDSQKASKVPTRVKERLNTNLQR